MKENIIATKTYVFALKAIKPNQHLTAEKHEFVLSKQFLRSATPIGAHVEESVGGQSEKDFFMKLNIAYKEARESHYWLRLLKDNNRIESILRACRVINFKKNRNALMQTESASQFTLSSNIIDYIFTNPPFGANIMNLELNFLWESWLKVKTDNKPEAIENKALEKTLLDYERLMEGCFEEYYRVLKPGRWMTVELSATLQSWSVITLSSCSAPVLLL
jgi:four helix bundle protein